jgi:anti-anti-sigma factor
VANVLSALCGDIDRSTVAAFREGLYRSIDAANDEIVEIDLAGVTFIDSAGYCAVVEANAYAVGTDHLLVIRNLSGPCTKLVRICDQDNELRLENDSLSSN